MKKRVCLDGNWELAFCRHDDYKEVNSRKQIENAGFKIIQGNVPGNFELDFQRAGIIDEPFFANNVLNLQEYEDVHLWYIKKFSYEKTDLVPNILFDGIDTFSEIFLNGKLLGTTDNMLIEHKFYPENLLFGDNELVIHIFPTAVKARELPSYPLEGAAIYNYGGLHVRKAPHMYGWDIMPRILSGGIWRSVWLEEESSDCIEETYLYTNNVKENQESTTTLYYRVKATLGNIQRYSLKITGSCGKSSFEKIEKLWFTSGKLTIKINDSQLWWPMDKGAQNLYDVKVELLCDGQKVDEKDFCFGLRVVELEREAANSNYKGKFNVKVNGKKVFIHGTNWVPADAFHSRDKERIPKMIDMAVDLKCNMIRCWGGNVYEDDLFFDLCDKNGILVWQDFSMACATYPRDIEFCKKLEKEAISVVKKLRQHPSLFMWAGDNENDLVNMDGWYGIPSDPQENILTRQILPSVVSREDPARPYLPSSPYVHNEFVKGIDKLVEDHLWGPRDYYKSPFYTTENNPRFVSETGYHGSVSPESAKKFLSEEALWPMENNKEWLTHAASMEPFNCAYDYRIKLMKKQVETIFGQFPDNFNDFAIASQICEAEAIKFYIEKFRIDSENRGGILWWNLIDGWPQFSDSVVDYYFCKKQAYFNIKNSQQPLCLMFGETDGNKRTLYAVNNLLTDVSFDYKVTDVSNDNVVVCKGSGTIGSETTIELDSINDENGKKGMYLITWESDELCGKNHYLYGEPIYSLKDCLDWYKKSNIWCAEGF